MPRSLFQATSASFMLAQSCCNGTPRWPRRSVQQPGSGLCTRMILRRSWFHRMNDPAGECLPSTCEVALAASENNSHSILINELKARVSSQELDKNVLLLQQDQS